MPWHDDSWRDSYDDWKLASPDDYEPDECHHEESDIDFWEGRSHCARCGETWWASADEIRYQREQQAEYDAWCKRQERREFLRWLTYPIRWPVYRLLELIWPRKACNVLMDEEIPF